MAKHDAPKLKKISVNLPFGIGGTEWEPDASEARAAWSLYVELVTRIAIQPLSIEQDYGLLREALTSLHSLFATTRQILREAGPGVGASKQSVGAIAIAVLNRGLRPFLSKWHPLLQAWEALRAPDVNPVEYERSWEKEEQLRQELELLRQDLEQYAIALSVIAGVDYYQ
ncbi:hypothetical protein RIVM261_020980 [Rivularia sp. IAM M-261]|nr:hypothetical protein CAL7716_026130 [Calothrix sp. PCC 7716]GJD17142.1 hypothetical protein RIVM261_020980 [Rivularia sp. IAM M-261]